MTTKNWKDYEAPTVEGATADRLAQEAQKREAILLEGAEVIETGLRAYGRGRSRTLSQKDASELAEKFSKRGWRVTFHTIQTGEVWVDVEDPTSRTP